MKATLVLKMDENGKSENRHVVTVIENWYDYPANREILVFTALVPLGWRTVEPWEKKKYKKPSCAKYWDDRYNRFSRVSDDVWFCDANIYIVPENFEFEEEWVTPTDEDAKRRPKVEVRDNDNDVWHTPHTLLAVHNEMFIAMNDTNGHVYTWPCCRMKASLRKEEV